MTPHQKTFFLCGLTCIIAGLLAAVGDTCLLYSPEGGYLKGDYRFLQEIGHSRLLWGHYLGVLFIPLQIAGMWIIYQGLKPGGKFAATAAAVLGTYATAVGVAYHGGVYPLVLAVQSEPESINSLLDWLKPFSEPLGLAFAVAFLALMAIFAGLVATGNSHFPRWIILFSPIVTYPLIFALYALIPPLGNLLAPAGFNLCMAIFYTAILTGVHLPEEGELW